ncbi:MAG: lipopolysaccharide heptosyltransferase II [Victivallales bacterium]|nr:lipopolysaccharide heptosyltransferase II [Victivallales bacterium]
MLTPYRPVIKRLPAFQLESPIHDWRGGLVVRLTNWLGDCLMTLPALWQLRQCLPHDCPLVGLAPAGLAPLWQACPWFDQIIPLDGKRSDGATRQKLRSLHLGAALVNPNSFGSAMDVWHCGIPRRVGRAGRWRSLLLTDKFPEWPAHSNLDQCHQLSYYFQLVSAFGDIAWTDKCPSLRTSPDAAAKLGVTTDGNWTALAPGAAFGPAKQWPAAYFADVARELARQGQRIVILGTANDRETAALIGQQGPSALDLTGRTSLAELMSVLASVQRVLANDSGTMHLAAALGTPGVAVFGSTDPLATGPLGGRWLLRISEASCRPCFRRTCPLAGPEQYKCLKEITPEIILADLKELDK